MSRLFIDVQNTHTHTRTHKPYAVITENKEILCVRANAQNQWNSYKMKTLKFIEIKCYVVMHMISVGAYSLSNIAKKMKKKKNLYLSVYFTYQLKGSTYKVVMCNGNDPFHCTISHTWKYLRVSYIIKNIPCKILSPSLSLSVSPFLSLIHSLARWWDLISVLMADIYTLFMDAHNNND